MVGEAGVGESVELGVVPREEPLAGLADGGLEKKLALGGEIGACLVDRDEDRIREPSQNRQVRPE